MDGIGKRLKDSLQFRLSVWLSVVILAVATAAGGFSLVSAFTEAHALQDDTLRQVASLVDSQRLVPGHPLGLTAAHGDDDGEESRVLVQRVADGGNTSGNVDSGAPLPLPAGIADGWYTLPAGGEGFRVLVRTTSDGNRIAVAQETGVRDQLAWRSAFRTLLPFLLLVPVLLLAVADLVRRTFRPVADLSAEINQRAEQQLHPVDDSQLPTEIQPFVVAINRLLERVDASMNTQRRFIADAAHELRSPLTALSLQAERLAAADKPEQARESIASLRRGIQRTRNLLDQLLAMAKAQAPAGPLEAPVSVLAVFRRVLEDLLPLAEARHVDVGVIAPQDVCLLVSEVDLSILVRNLVDNAIRHSPDAARVDLAVSVHGDRARLEIRDQGPGIPEAERTLVFEPFYRCLGTRHTGAGLGLSIVRTIAERIGALVWLDYADEAGARGLRISIEFSLNPALQGSGVPV